MTPAAVTATRDVTSTDLCRRALEAYDAVHVAAARYDDPDLGLAIICHLGRSRLASRLDAAPWPVSPETAAAAAWLVDRAPLSATCEDLVEWLEAFPAAFLAVLDRRARQTQPVSGGRRAWDRVTAR
jgi:hypothetical protein